MSNLKQSFLTFDDVIFLCLDELKKAIILIIYKIILVYQTGTVVRVFQ